MLPGTEQSITLEVNEQNLERGRERERERERERVWQDQYDTHEYE